MKKYKYQTFYLGIFIIYFALRKRNGLVPICLQAGHKPSVMYFVDVLRSSVSNNLYKGMTNNLSRRLKEHNSGNNKSTKSEIPWKMVYHEIVKIELKLEKERNILNLALEENI